MTNENNNPIKSKKILVKPVDTMNVLLDKI